MEEKEKEEEYDWSVGDIIAAYEDGTIVLDDGITTFNPDRAKKFLKANARKRSK